MKGEWIEKILRRIEALKGGKHKDKRVDRKRKNKEDQSKAYNKKEKRKKHS